MQWRLLLAEHTLRLAAAAAAVAAAAAAAERPKVDPTVDITLELQVSKTHEREASCVSVQVEYHDPTTHGVAVISDDSCNEWHFSHRFVEIQHH